MRKAPFRKRWVMNKNASHVFSLFYFHSVKCPIHRQWNVADRTQWSLFSVWRYCIISFAFCALKSRRNCGTLSNGGLFFYPWWNWHHNSFGCYHTGCDFHVCYLYMFAWRRRLNVKVNYLKPRAVKLHMRK